MPKFNGQNKKRIDPRYFSEELLEEESAPPTPIDREIVRTSAEESPALAQRNKKMKARCAKYGKVFDAGKNKCVEDDPVDRTLDQLGVEPLEETGTRKEEIQRALKEQDDLLAMLDAQGVEAATDEEAAMYEKCVASGIKGTDCHRIAAGDWETLKRLQRTMVAQGKQRGITWTNKEMQTLLGLKPDRPVSSPVQTPVEKWPLSVQRDASRILNYIGDARRPKGSAKGMQKMYNIIKKYKKAGLLNQLYGAFDDDVAAGWTCRSRAWSCLPRRSLPWPAKGREPAGSLPKEIANIRPQDLWLYVPAHIEFDRSKRDKYGQTRRRRLWRARMAVRARKVAKWKKKIMALIRTN